MLKISVSRTISIVVTLMIRIQKGEKTTYRIRQKADYKIEAFGMSAKKSSKKAKKGVDKRWEVWYII